MKLVSFCIFKGLGIGSASEPDPKYIDMVQQYCTKQYIYHLCLNLLKCDTCDTGMNFTLIDIWISFRPNMESCGRLFFVFASVEDCYQSVRVLATNFANVFESF